LKRNTRNNIKILRKKENLEKQIEPVIIPRIIRLPAWFEPTRSSEIEGMEGSCDEEQCM
jgi:hypothetical protein